MDIPLSSTNHSRTSQQAMKLDMKISVCNIVYYLDCSWGMKQQNIEKKINKILPQTNIILLGMHSFINAELVLHLTFLNAIHIAAILSYFSIISCKWVIL